MATQQQVDRLGTVIEQVRTDLGNAPEPPVVTFSAATSLVDEYRTRCTSVNSRSTWMSRR